ncbi:hypothetical protein GCM10010254_71150 [Streptomyces chromofuscus]|nr:hypothetical protein GCM10010254_71150 [Streptomyces chromofuscus]
MSPGERVPTLKALDRDRRVVHLGSYAKTAFPGARVGFAVADQTVVSADGTTTLLADELAQVKSMVTVNTSTLSQAVVAGMLLAADGELSKANAPAARGKGSETVLTEVGPVETAVPRDQDGSFEPKIVRKRQKRLTGVDENGDLTGREGPDHR